MTTKLILHIRKIRSKKSLRLPPCFSVVVLADALVGTDVGGAEAADLEAHNAVAGVREAGNKKNSLV